jgi:hypothetical protein
MSFIYHIGKGLGYLAAKAVNSIDAPPKQHKLKEQMTRDVFVEKAFGSFGYSLMTDEGKEKYWLDYFQRIDPPKKELTESQKFSKDPKKYLDEYFKDYFNENQDHYER